MARRTAFTATVTAMVLFVSGCGTNGLASLPLPAPGIDSAAYTLKAVFANALNLPSRAKVKLGGADVGEVTAMAADNYSALITMKIRSGTEIPVGSTAELRTATLLGDVFVALKPPAHVDASTPLLHDGDTMGLSSTASAASVEGVLSSAAIVVNGGAVRNLTNTLNGLGRATGPNGEAFGNLIKQSNQLLGKLNRRSDQMDAALNGTAQLAAELDTRHQTVTDLLIAAAPATDVLADNSSRIADLADQVGAVADQLRKFPSIAGTDQGSRSVITDMNTLSSAFNDMAVNPDVSLAKLNRLLPLIVKITPSSAFSVKAQIDRLVLGSIPDAGYLGDIGFHGPKRYDWAKLVGSLKYTWWRLQERVVGQGPEVPQAPMRPSPTEPGVIEPVPPAPGEPR